MADESIRNANHAVAQALAEVNRNTEKIKAIEMDIKAIEMDIYAIEDEENFTGEEPRYKRLKARLTEAYKRLKEAKDDLKEAKDDLKEANERLKEAREYHLKLTLTDVQHIHKKNVMSTVVENEHINSIAQKLDIDAWQVGGISIDISRVESDFPEWFYIRKETLDIIKVFKAQMEAKLSIVFVGTPGVGKSMLVVLFAFYMALRQKKRVVLFRKKKGEGVSMLYMDGENEQYWRKDEASFDDLDLVENRDFELCLDGLLRQDIADNFARLARFRLLATSVQYPMKNDDMPVLRQCLVPFWSKCDLNAIGTHREWQEHEIKNKYFYSGGNLRDFLSEKITARDSIDEAVGVVDLPVAELLNTQYAVVSVKQVDRLRMTGIRANDHSDLNKYTTLRSWFCVITSEYALRQLGKIVEASYYEVLWSKGRMLGDDGLMGIAFENYHSYVALEFEAKSCRNDGMDAAECDTIMKQLSSSSDDYWYPSSRSLKTIDSVAKMTMPGQQNVVGLIQITKSDHHQIDSEVLDKYAGFFPNGSRYIALVPDKETCDNFRLAPADPATKVPLDVAYIKTWNL
ncbi:putative P-loop containing nucleoside triphosphate hydrolase [Plasmopara halstedii]